MPRWSCARACARPSRRSNFSPLPIPIAYVRGVSRLALVLGAAFATLVPAAPAGADTIFAIGGGPRSQQVFKVDPETGAASRLTKGTGPPFRLTAGPRPNTATVSRLVGRRNLDLFTVDARGGERRITHTPRVFEASGSWSPDGTRLAVVHGPVRNRGITGLAIYDRRGRRVRRLIARRGDNVVSQALWSPDGQWIAIRTDGAAGWRLDVMRPDGSGRRTVLGPERSPATFAWHPDGARVVIGDYATMRLVPIAGGDTTVVAGLEGTKPSWPAFSPDGSKLVFQDAKQGMARQLLDLATGAIRPLSPTPLFEAVWAR